MGGWGGREAQEGEEICILMTDSRYCMAETNTNQHNINYPPIKKRKVSPVKFHLQKFNSLFQRASWIFAPGHDAKQQGRDIVEDASKDSWNPGDAV